MERKTSALMALAMAARLASGTERSPVRVSTTLIPRLRSAAPRRCAIWSVRSFSLSPSGDRAPS